jgi:hypothetical protein
MQPASDSEAWRSEVEKLVGKMHRCLYYNAHNITIGEIHTNYAANKKVTAWNLDGII